MAEASEIDASAERPEPARDRRSSDLARKLEVLQRTTAAFSRALSADDVARVAIENGRAALGADAASFGLVRGDQIEICAWKNYSDEVMARWRSFPLDDPEAPMARAARARRALFLDAADVVESVRERPLIPNLSGAVVVLPLSARDRLLAVLSLGFERRRSFSDEERAFIESVGEQCAQALDRALIYEGQRALASVAAQLTSVAAALAVARSPTEVAEVAVQQCSAALRACSGVACAVSADGRALEVVAYGGKLEAELMRAYARMPLDDHTPLAVSAREGQEIWISDAAEYAARFPETAQLAGSRGVRAACVLPMQVDDRRLGCIGFSFDHDRRFDEAERALLVAIGRQCAQAFERERLAAEARRALELLVAAVGKLPIGVLVADAAGAVLACNDEARRIWAPLPLRSLDDLAPLRGFLPGGREIARGEWPLERALATGQDVPDGEVHAILPDNRELMLRLGARPVELGAGRPRAAVLTMRDVTEERRGRERETFLAEAAALLASTLDAEPVLRQLVQLAVPRVADWCLVHRYQGGELRLAAIAGVDPALAHRALQTGSAAGADTVVDRVARTGEPELVPEIDEAALQKAARDDVQLQELLTLGFTSAVVVPLKGRSEPLGALTFCSSVSRRRYGEPELRLATDLAHRAALAIENARLYAESERARKQAEDATRLKDEFLATLSHEMRTPLTAILGWVGMLRGRGEVPEPLRHAVDTIERNARAQLQMVEDLLDVSRIVAGKLRLAPRDLALAEVLDAAVEAVHPTALIKGIKLTAELDGAPVVLGDPDRLRQVIWNLLANAIKFTPAGGEVTVSLRDEGESALLEVRDTGRGIPASFMPHLFSRFRQSEGGTTRAEGGLGLGLAIARHLVEMHGGSIWAESEGEGRGARFALRLPRKAELQAPSLPPPARAAPEEPPAAEVAPSLEGLRVLVVEDDDDSRELIGIILEGHGARVALVSSVSSALAALAGERFDALLSDVSMPGEDGYSLVRKLRASQQPALPAAALTANVRPEDRDRALQAGFQLHIGKPVEPAELVRAVHELARLRL